MITTPKERRKNPFYSDIDEHDRNVRGRNHRGVDGRTQAFRSSSKFMFKNSRPEIGTGQEIASQVEGSDVRVNDLSQPAGRIALDLSPKERRDLEEANIFVYESPEPVRRTERDD